MPNKPWKQIAVVFIVLVLFAAPVFAQESGDVEVIESELDFGPSMNAVTETVRPPMRDVQPKRQVISSEMQMPAQGLLKEEQLVELNFLIKQMVEQFEALESRREELDRELRFIRGQRRLDQNRLGAINDEMRQVREQTEQVIALNQQYSRQLIELRMSMADRDQQYQLRIKELEDRIERGDIAPVPGTESLVAGEGAPAQDADLMVMIDQINREGERLKHDTAKVHYNMGNIYFHKGEYKKAVTEYKKAIKLVPSDAASHFNLAFVSGEYLYDHPVAVKHYRQYLLLSPDASDADEVRKKLLQAELSVRVTIDSPIDKPELRQ